MDKLNLPLPGDQGPASYDNAYLHFERVGPRRFRLTVGLAADAGNWRAASRAQRLDYWMSGRQREYGFYS